MPILEVEHIQKSFGHTEDVYKRQPWEEFKRMKEEKEDAESD